MKMRHLSKINTYLDNNKSIGIFLLRLFIGLRLIYGVIDNIFSWEKMLEFSEFLKSSGLPFPIVAAISSVYLQFFCSIFLVLGIKIRLVALLLAINFLVAIGVHIVLRDSIEGMTPALAIFFGCVTLVFTGSGKTVISIRKLDI